MKSRHSIWGHIWQISVSSPDGPSQLTATRHDSRHLALKPIQACGPAWGWEPRRTPAAGRPDAQGLQCELCNIKKKKIKKLKRKVKYALLAYILQDDFGSLLVKSKLLECCFSLISPPKSLKEVITEQASWNLTQLPHLCFCTGGEDGDARAW